MMDDDTPKRPQGRPRKTPFWSPLAPPPTGRRGGKSGKPKAPTPDELADMERLVSAAKALIEANDLGTGPRRIARARDVSAFAGATIRPVWTRRQPAAMAKLEEALRDPRAGLDRLREKIRGKGGH